MKCFTFTQWPTKKQESTEALNVEFSEVFFSTLINCEWVQPTHHVCTAGVQSTSYPTMAVLNTEFNENFWLSWAVMGSIEFLTSDPMWICNFDYQSSSSMLLSFVFCHLSLIDTPIFVIVGHDENIFVEIRISYLMNIIFSLFMVENVPKKPPREEFTIA